MTEKPKGLTREDVSALHFALSVALDTLDSNPRPTGVDEVFRDAIGKLQTTMADRLGSKAATMNVDAAEEIRSKIADARNQEVQDSVSRILTAERRMMADALSDLQNSKANYDRMVAEMEDAQIKKTVHDPNPTRALPVPPTPRPRGPRPSATTSKERVRKPRPVSAYMQRVYDLCEGPDAPAFNIAQNEVANIARFFRFLIDEGNTGLFQNHRYGALSKALGIWFHHVGNDQPKEYCERAAKAYCQKYFPLALGEEEQK